MRKFLAATVLAAAAVVSPHAQSEQIPVEHPGFDGAAEAINESSDLWFVELASAPAEEGTSVAALEREEAQFHSAASAAGVTYTERRHFRKLWNGLTVRATAGERSKLAALPGVRAVYPVVRIEKAQDSDTNFPELATALNMTGASTARTVLGFTGRGIKVAVMDTGVDFHHPDLGGCFGPGCRVAFGFDLVGDAFNFSDTTATTPVSPEPVPDPIPDDCNGHGTHVAGIVGARGGITGVAPEVTFGAYRVFGCDGNTSAEIMLAAMELIADDDMDVLNMSIGSSFQWPQYPTAQASDRLVKRGMVVVASAGNSGTNGLYASSAPALGDRVISVASYDNTHLRQRYFTVSPDGSKIGYLQAAAAPIAPTSGTFSMARTGTTTTADDACAPLAAGSLTGRVALIRRGTCTFNQKSFNAQNAGAVGVVIYNNVPGIQSITVVGPPDILIPVVSISQAQGVLISNRLAAGSVSMTWTDQFDLFPNVTGNLISAFSSYGPSPSLSVKPDIGAPGGLIRSTIPVEQGSYGTISGTSMSSPHVAGGVALLLQARPRLRPAEVRDLIQNSADPQVWSLNPALGFLDQVHRQGAGMLDIDDAILAETIVSPGKLSLGELEAGRTVTRTIRVKGVRGANSGRRGGDDDDEDGRPVTYTLGHQPALATGPNTFVPSFFASFAAIQFSRPTIVFGGDDDDDDDEDASVAVTFTPPANANARLFGGYITLTPEDGSAVIRVPYAGYSGDYQAIQVLVPTAAGFPWLAKLVGPNFVNQPGGATFTLVGDDVPFFLLHLDHQSELLRAEVVNVDTGMRLDLAFEEEFLPRNSGATTFFAFAWDGSTFRKAGRRTRPVPDGRYVLEFSVLKALGDPRNPAHVERWTSPNVTIARPMSTTP